MQKGRGGRKGGAKEFSREELGRLWELERRLEGRGLGSHLTGYPVQRTVCAAFRENTNRWNRWNRQGGLPTCPTPTRPCAGPSS